uniref:DUF4283 domain-containing protein n=1 Tax=Salix viminalis TaxID=40686 RepID=A0A6N2L5Z0_SALVM
MGKVKRAIEPLGTGLVLWQNQSKFQWSDRSEDVMLLDNGFYVFKLRSEENCNAVLGVGPYHIAGKLLILKKCQPTGRASLQKQLCYFFRRHAGWRNDNRGCGTSDGGGDFMILEAGFTKLCGNGNADGGEIVLWLMVHSGLILKWNNVLLYLKIKGVFVEDVIIHACCRLLLEVPVFNHRLYLTCGCFYRPLYFHCSNALSLSHNKRFLDEEFPFSGLFT